MNRCLLLACLLLTGPGLAQTGDSKAGIPFSPTMPYGYPTATYAPPGGFTQHTSGYYYGYGAGYSGGHYAGHFYGDNYNGSVNRGARPYPGSYANSFGATPPARSAGRNWPSASDESSLHEIRR